MSILIPQISIWPITSFQNWGNILLVTSFSVSWPPIKIIYFVWIPGDATVRYQISNVTLITADGMVGWQH